MNLGFILSLVLSANDGKHRQTCTKAIVDDERYIILSKYGSCQIQTKKTVDGPTRTAFIFPVICLIDLYIHIEMENEVNNVLHA